MFRNIDDQRNNLILFISQCIFIIIVKEVHQSLNEAMRLSDENVEEHFLLLTNFYVVAMDTQSKQVEVVDWLE